MDPKRVRSRGKRQIGQSIERNLHVLIVNADTAFDGNGYGNRLFHG